MADAMRELSRYPGRRLTSIAATRGRGVVDGENDEEHSVGRRLAHAPSTPGQVPLIMRKGLVGQSYERYE